MNTDIVNKQKELSELAAKQAALQAEIAAAKKENRASTLNEVVNTADETIRGFIGVADEAEEMTAEQSKEYAEFISDLLTELKGLKPKKSASSGSGERLTGDEKTARDNQIADALRSGKTAKEVAAQFGVSEGTVNIVKRTHNLTTPRGKVTVTPRIEVQPVNLG